MTLARAFDESAPRLDRLLTRTLDATLPAGETLTLGFDEPVTGSLSYRNQWRRASDKQLQISGLDKAFKGFPVGISTPFDVHIAVDGGTPNIHSITQKSVSRNSQLEVISILLTSETDLPQAGDTLTLTFTAPTGGLEYGKPKRAWAAFRPFSFRDQVIEGRFADVTERARFVVRNDWTPWKVLSNFYFDGSRWEIQGVNELLRRRYLEILASREGNV